MKHLVKYRYLVFAILVFFFGKLTDWNILFPRFDTSYSDKFQKIFSNKEREIENYLLYIEKAIKNKNSTIDLQTKLGRFHGLLEKEGYGIFIYKSDSLVFWSDNSVLLNNKFVFSGLDSIYVNLRNAWFAPKIKQVGDWKIVGLMQIKQVYLYENKYLVNEFQRDFSFPSTVKISSRQVPDGFPIFNNSGTYLFSLVFDNTCKHPWFQLYIPVCSYFAGLILLAIFLFGFIGQISNKKRRYYAILILSVLLICLKLISVTFRTPGIFYELELFNPQFMAISQLLPSLGDLLLWAMIVFFITYLLYKHISIPAIRIDNKYYRIILLAIISILITLAFIVINFLFNNIVLNSSISFEAQKVLMLNAYSFIGYMVFILLFCAYAFFVDKCIVYISECSNFQEVLIIYFCSSLVIVAALWSTSFQMGIVSYITLLLLVLAIGYIRLYLKTTHQFTGVIGLVFIFALYTVDKVIVLTLQKNKNETKVLATNLANQHDPVAEYLMEEASSRIIKDTVIINNLFRPEIEFDLTNYLENTYFDGYFEKFKLQVIPCFSADSLYFIPPDNYYRHCNTYFEELVHSRGLKLPSSSFYYIDNQNGRVSYLGWFNFVKPNSNEQITLYLELDSKVISYELGYPELLLDKKIAQKSKYRDYSYAKYFKGRLINKFGYFPYDLSSKEFILDSSQEEFSTKKLYGFNHLIFRTDKNSLIVISYPKVGFFEFLIAFSWIFLFYILVITFVTVFTNLPFIQRAFRPDFKNKIQYSIMSVLFSSLILIGGGTILFSIRQYNNRHLESLEEKMRSIYVEVSQKIGHEEKITSGWQQYPYNNLNELLAKFSDVFYADINLFDPIGNLVATSRPEVFEKGLIGTKINPSAFNELAVNKKAQYIHNENIGKLVYLSGYIPLLNNDNELIAYLNIPYFTRQEELRHDISTLVVGIINVYVILLLISIVISIIISRRITMPLRLIQKKFSEIKLGQHYENIEYSGEDEIGGLVLEYNRMVKELAKSIELLAKSERESAWREMARQIAHEINNPLTPMKLSVQQLLRAHHDKSEKFDEYLERISQTLIEEIDNLSSIASEFSNFAKMPQAHNQNFNLVDKINTVINLFANNEADFIINLNQTKPVEIFADKEQISRVFINLFKNAIQSVERGVNPVITVSLHVIKGKAIVQVTDNGKGIPELLRDKLFRPNFTTKSSGMGLGLAIIKNIMDGLGGSITFKTETGKGTSFILEFPVYLSDKKSIR